MSQNSLINVLEANRLLRSPNEVALFEQTLEKLAQNPDPVALPCLHLILDDGCEQPEVMFSLVHFLESFDVKEQVQAFIQVLPELVKRAKDWTAILHSRMMNDASARAEFEERVRAMEAGEQEEIFSLILRFLERELETKLAAHLIEFSKVLERYGYSKEYTVSFQIVAESNSSEDVNEAVSISRENALIKLNFKNVFSSSNMLSFKDLATLESQTRPPSHERIERLCCVFSLNPPELKCGEEYCS